MAASTEQIASIAEENLYLFSNPDSAARKAGVQKLWHPSGSVLLVDPQAVSTTYDEIEAVTVGLQAEMPGFVFTKIGDVQILPSFGDTTIARVKWGFGPPGGEYKLTGEDSLTIKGSKIERLYVFFD